MSPYRDLFTRRPMESITRIRTAVDVREAAAFVVLFMLASAALSFCVEGCKPADVPRETARAAMLTVAEGVRVSDDACASVAYAQRNAKLASTCAEAYNVARAALIAGEDSLAVSYDPSAIACSVTKAAKALASISDAIYAAGGRVPPAADDAVRFAASFSGVCRGAQ